MRLSSWHSTLFCSFTRGLILTLTSFPLRLTLPIYKVGCQSLTSRKFFGLQVTLMQAAHRWEGWQVVQVGRRNIPGRPLEGILMIGSCPSRCECLQGEQAGRGCWEGEGTLMKREGAGDASGWGACALRKSSYPPWLQCVTPRDMLPHHPQVLYFH